jgi:hypothetical protein
MNTELHLKAEPNDLDAFEITLKVQVVNTV